MVHLVSDVRSQMPEAGMKVVLRSNTKDFNAFACIWPPASVS